MIFLKKTKNYWFVAIAVIAAWFLLRSDSFLYQEPVGQVTHVKVQSKQKTTDEHNNTDNIYHQQLTVKLLNRNKIIKLTNQYTDSQTVTHKYKVGDQLLLTGHAGYFRIISLKRDAVIGSLVVLLLGLLLIYGKWRATSWLTLSLVANVILFAIALYIDVHLKNPNVILIFSILAIVVASLSLVLVLGRTLQMVVTLLATLLSTVLTMFIMFAALKITGNEGVHFETMSYVTQVPVTLFIAQTIIGVLGAVMDEAADIVAALFGLRREKIERHFKDYWHAGMNVGRDIMGTLINVLFMIFIAETMPMVFLMLRNGNNWPYILDQIMNLGILQTVISGIGIVLAVPVTSALVGWIAERYKVVD
ncbi:YibE/F family protein [Leuconostoc mesenteroides]|uniref:YibE/F family protein n=1 Tax=Leuconostoc mesenteroides TaxID=1245 RepID=UPI0022467A89|nr:YibE/F family protein [Leuconostoc mesenteroides]MCX2665840.1 YibE/F family protein [Leuconostoc mesenteroides subsp. mesenteroides]